ncbi:RNase H domain protein [Xylaria cubensis]|nr:RNase H domain protein [Xylaria cubensis]
MSLGSCLAQDLASLTLSNGNDEEGPDVFYDENRRGTGRVFPTVFTPPSTLVDELNGLPPEKATGASIGYIHRRYPNTILIFTKGACLNNGRPNPNAGWAFAYGPGFEEQPAIPVSGQLEDAGPFDETNNRAELHAVIAALRFRDWDGEGFQKIIIATDLEYVFKGATTWAKYWIIHNWKRKNGHRVKNIDMWEMLLGEVEKWHDRGVPIKFWLIRKAWNTVAHVAAKKAAEQVDAEAQ